MQNISAVLQEIGRHWISGYKPRVNVGEQTKSRMLDVLIEISPQTFEDYLPTADEEEIRRRTHALLRKKVPIKPAGVQHPRIVSRNGQQFERSPAVRAFVLAQAHGVCELCGNPAPLVDDDGCEVLEVHHVLDARESLYTKVARLQRDEPPKQSA